MGIRGIARYVKALAINDGWDAMTREQQDAMRETWRHDFAQFDRNRDDPDAPDPFLLAYVDPGMQMAYRAEADKWKAQQRMTDGVQQPPELEHLEPIPGVLEQLTAEGSEPTRRIELELYEEGMRAGGSQVASRTFRFSFDGPDLELDDRMVQLFTQMVAVARGWFAVSEDQ